MRNKSQKGYNGMKEGFSLTFFFILGDLRACLNNDRKSGEKAKEEN